MNISAIPPESILRGPVSPASDQLGVDWASLPELPLPSARALRHRLPAATAPHSAAAGQFDVLRTRMLGVVEERRWTRIGITQPRSRSAAAYAAANLAFSLARRPSLRVMLADLDLHTPRLTEMLGLPRALDLGQALRSGIDLCPALSRFGSNLALLGNSAPDRLAAETLQEPDAAAAITRLIGKFAPDVVLLVLPPLLEGDAGLSGLGMVETLLMVADGTSTLPAELRSCDRLVEGGPPILGVVLVDAEH